MAETAQIQGFGMIKRLLRKWLGIEAMQVHLDLLTPKDFGTPGFTGIKYQGRSVELDSSPLKSMTPYERSLEDSKEIRERIETLLK